MPSYKDSNKYNHWRPRVPTAKGTRWHKDKSKYERRRKYKHDSDTGDEDMGRHTQEETEQ